MFVDEGTAEEARVSSTVDDEPATPPGGDQVPSIAVWVAADAAVATNVRRNGATILITMRESSSAPGEEVDAESDI